MYQRFGNIFLKASVGFGGSCFQKDILNLVYLSKFYGLDEVAEYWHQVVKINDFQKDRFAQKIINYFEGNIKNKSIAILGWSFKANTNDSRESPSIYITKKLYMAGAKLEIYDPLVPKNKILEDIENYWSEIDKIDYGNIKFRNKSTFLDSNFDCFAILTDWEDFSKLKDRNHNSSIPVFYI